MNSSKNLLIDDEEQENQQEKFDIQHENLTNNQQQQQQQFRQNIQLSNIHKTTNQHNLTGEEKQSLLDQHQQGNSKST